MTKLGVVHVIEDLGIGGLERVVVTLCTAIDRERFDLSVLCLRGTGPLADELAAVGVPVIDIGGRPGTADYLAFRKVARHLRERRPDVLHTHNSLALFDGFAAAKMLGVPTLVHTDHARNFPDKLRYMAAEHLISYFLYRVVAVSEHTRDNLVRYERISPRRIVTIPNGIDGSRYEVRADAAAKRRELGLPPEGPVIGMGARLTEQKGVTYLLQAMARLKERMPALRAVVAGEGELGPELKREAAARGVADRVHFVGPRLDMPELLQLFDAYVISSIWEGLPMALLEAMAAGCPVVATEVGGIPRAIRSGENGSLVRPRDPVALADELERVLSNGELRRRYAVEARLTFASQYSAEAMTRRYEQLYLRQATN